MYKLGGRDVLSWNTPLALYMFVNNHFRRPKMIPMEGEIPDRSSLGCNCWLTRTITTKEKSSAVALSQGPTAVATGAIPGLLLSLANRFGWCFPQPQFLYTHTLVWSLVDALGGPSADVQSSLCATFCSCSALHMVLALFPSLDSCLYILNLRLS